MNISPNKEQGKHKSKMIIKGEAGYLDGRPVYKKWSEYTKAQQEDYRRKVIGFGKEVDPALDTLTEAVKKYGITDPKNSILISWDTDKSRFMMNLAPNYIRISDSK